MLIHNCEVYQGLNIALQDFYRFLTVQKLKMGIWTRELGINTLIERGWQSSWL